MKESGRLTSFVLHKTDRPSYFRTEIKLCKTDNQLVTYKIGAITLDRISSMILQDYVTVKITGR